MYAIIHSELKIKSKNQYKKEKRIYDFALFGQSASKMTKDGKFPLRLRVYDL